MKKIYFLSIGLYLSAASNAQTTVTFAADKDNTIFSAFPGKSNGAGQYFFAGRNSGTQDNSIQRALLHFDISSIPAGSVITAATLTLTVGKTAANATGVDLHRLTAAWGEGTSNAGSDEGQGADATPNDATWNQSFFGTISWITPGGDFFASPSASIASIAANINANTTVTLSGAGLMSDVQGWLITPGANFGWLVKSNNEATSRSVKRFISRNHEIATIRPSLSVTYTPGTMPVTLNNFSGSVLGQDAVLRWVTATETDNKYFDIQHSIDGVHFNSVGQVEGNGTTSIEHSYTFTHKNIGAGKHLYRIVQTDLDGVSRISKIIVVSLNLFDKLQVYPNPALTFVAVSASSLLTGADFIISSNSGQTIKQGKINNQQIDVQKLSPGQYWLTIKTINGEILKSGFLKK